MEATLEAVNHDSEQTNVRVTYLLGDTDVTRNSRIK